MGKLSDAVPKITKREQRGDGERTEKERYYNL